MNALEATELATPNLPAYVERCREAIELVAPFASDALLDALETEIATLQDTLEVRALS